MEMRNEISNDLIVGETAASRSVAVGSSHQHIVAALPRPRLTDSAAHSLTTAASQDRAGLALQFTKTTISVQNLLIMKLNDFNNLEQIHSNQ